jgi:hypothetical protein
MNRSPETVLDKMQFWEVGPDEYPGNIASALNKQISRIADPPPRKMGHGERGAPERNRHLSLRLGRILLDDGRIDRRQLRIALREQGRSGKRLGEILVEKGYARSADISHGLRLQRSLATAALIAVLSLVPVIADPLARAGSTSTDLRITANVLPRSQLTVRYQVSTLVVTAVDIQKGYVDAPAATRISVKDNNKAGYSLVFEGLEWPFREALVLGLARSVQIGPPGAFVHQPYAKAGVTIELSYRLMLADDAAAGTYAWPLSVSVQPI